MKPGRKVSKKIPRVDDTRAARRMYVEQEVWRQQCMDLIEKRYEEDMQVLGNFGES